MRFELQPLIFMKSRLRDGLVAKGLDSENRILSRFQNKARITIFSIANN